jgi:hypothetical protein
VKLKYKIELTFHFNIIFPITHFLCANPQELDAQEEDPNGGRPERGKPEGHTDRMREET